MSEPHTIRGFVEQVRTAGGAFTIEIVDECDGSFSLQCWTGNDLQFRGVNHTRESARRALWAHALSDSRFAPRRRYFTVGTIGGI